MGNTVFTGAAEDIEAVNSFNWKSVPPPKLIIFSLHRSTEFKLEGDEAKPSHTVAPSSPILLNILSLSQVLLPSLPPLFLPKSQPKRNIDSSSPKSISPVFAHTTAGIDLIMILKGVLVVVVASAGSVKKSRKGYRYGGYGYI